MRSAAPAGLGVPGGGRPRVESRTWERVAGGTIFALGVALAIFRVGLSLVNGSDKLGARWAMIDFYSSAYYPVRALLEGGNPHDRTWFLSHYPVADMYGPFLPVNLLLHLPFGLLSPQLAGLVYFGLTVLLTLLMAALSLRLAGWPVTWARTGLIAGLILLSRPGHWTLLLGQQAILLTCFTYLALLSARNSPARSGLALALAALKPTFGIPLGLLMLAAGYLRAVVAGFVISLAVNLPLLWLMASRVGGIRPFLETLVEGVREWASIATYDPSTNHRQVDTAALVDRFMGHSLSGGAEALVAVGILAVAALAFRRLDRDHASDRDLATAIVCMTLLVAGHHLGYDMVILAAPAVILVLRGLPPGAPTVLRPIFLVLYAIPALNWINTDSVMDAWRPRHAVWLFVSSVNGLCLAILFVGYVALALTYGTRQSVLRLDRAAASAV
ncbi:MAG: glycosyltransferase family 87 protein [Gemmatimonadales bacterium]